MDDWGGCYIRFSYLTLFNDEHHWLEDLSQCLLLWKSLGVIGGVLPSAKSSFRELVRFSNKFAEVLNRVTSASRTETYLEERAKHRAQLGTRSVKYCKPGPISWPARSSYQFIFDLAESHYDFITDVLVGGVMARAIWYRYNFILQMLPLQYWTLTFFGHPHQDWILRVSSWAQFSTGIWNEGLAPDDRNQPAVSSKYGPQNGDECDWCW